MTLAFADKIHNSKSFQQNGLRPYIEKLATYKDDGQLQVVHTPFWLCEDILRKVSEFRNLKNSNILVLFNLEFVDVLLDTFRVKPTKITFAADAEKKLDAAKAMGCKTLTVTYSKKRGVEIMPEPKKKFDVVVMNPPYQPPVKTNKKNGGSGSRNTLWDKFVDLSLKISNTDGHLCHVHPSIWRKPDNELWPIITSHNVQYLELHNESDGMKTFKASTPYDWYILHKGTSTCPTTVKDITGKKREIDLQNLPFLPNSKFEFLCGLLAKDGEDKCEVLFSYKEYETRKSWMKEEKSGRFKHPCVHATSKEEIRYWHSSRKGRFFGTPKVIFGEARRPWQVIVDMDGDFGITQQAMGLVVKSKNEAQNLKKALESDAFYEFLETVRWSGFRIDWRMFKYFRADFWKEFV